MRARYCTIPAAAVVGHNKTVEQQTRKKRKLQNSLRALWQVKNVKKKQLDHRRLWGTTQLLETQC